jgi:hypothetical protein
VIGRWTVVNTVLVLIVLAVAAQIGRTWMRTRAPLPVVEGESERSAKRRPPRRPRPASDPEEMVVRITEQDLFDPSRKAEGTEGDTAPAELAEDETPPPPPGVTVVGVRLLGEDREAFVKDSSNASGQRRVRLGDDVGGYTVEEIRETSVVLEASNGNRVTLWLSLVPTSDVVRPTAQTGATTANQAVRRTTPPQASPQTDTAAQRAARRQRRRRPAAGARRGRYRQEPKESLGSPQLPDGVRERLEQLRQGS